MHLRGRAIRYKVVANARRQSEMGVVDVFRRSRVNRKERTGSQLGCPIVARLDASRYELLDRLAQFALDRIGLKTDVGPKQLRDIALEKDINDVDKLVKQSSQGNLTCSPLPYQWID